MERTLRIVSNLSALLGVVVFVYPLLSIEELNLSALQWVVISISIAVFFGYLVYEIFINKPKRYKSDEKITKYMKNWIGKRGRTVIFTRDMSWANDQQTMDLLRAKARSSELIICHPTKTHFTRELETLGAEVFEYSNLNFIPKSRFTFINYGTPYSKVAIGKKDDNHNHFIEEYTIKNTVEYFLAEDLVNLVKAIP